MGGESSNVQVHRFGHWACGWFELILINPVNKDIVKKAEDIMSALSDYPVVDEDFIFPLYYFIIPVINGGKKVQYIVRKNRN
jgi:hypothetical protein